VLEVLRPEGGRLLEGKDFTGGAPATKSALLLCFAVPRIACAQGSVVADGSAVTIVAGQPCGVAHAKPVDEQGGGSKLKGPQKSSTIATRHTIVSTRTGALLLFNTGVHCCPFAPPAEYAARLPALLEMHLRGLMLMYRLAAGTTPHADLGSELLWALGAVVDCIQAIILPELAQMAELVNGAQLYLPDGVVPDGGHELAPSL
jgi:hypothetical protein